MPTDPLLNIKLTSSICSFFALLATIFRLYIRRGRYWWDDGWALFSLLSLLVQIAGVFMHVPNPAELSKTNRVAAYYIIATAFYAIIWPARLSILYSVIRIETNPIKRQRLYYVVALFIFAGVFLISQLFWVCEPIPGWKDKPSPQCPLTKQVAICQLVGDIISDLLLIIAPLSLIRNLMDVALRRRLTLIFSTSIITTIVSLVHAAFILRDGGPKVLVAAFVENTVSLIVCNLPVIAASLLRLQSTSDSEDLKHVSTLRFKGSKSRFTSRRSKNTNTVDITTTFALDELNDERTTGQVPLYDYKQPQSSHREEKTITSTSDASNYPSSPPGVHVVQYPHPSDYGPDTGTPFKSYFDSENRYKNERQRNTKGVNETQSRVEFTLPNDPKRNDGI